MWKLHKRNHITHAALFGISFFFVFRLSVPLFFFLKTISPDNLHLLQAQPPHPINPTMSPYQALTHAKNQVLIFSFYSFDSYNLMHVCVHTYIHIHTYILYIYIIYMGCICFLSLKIFLETKMIFFTLICIFPFALNNWWKNLKSTGILILFSSFIVLHVWSYPSLA